MIFENYKPPFSPLNKHVETLIHFKDFPIRHSIERVVPTGHVFIVFELDGIPRNTFDNETLNPINTYTKVWVSGMHKNFISISAHPNSEMFVIQFKPAGPYPFLHFPLHRIAEKVVSGEEIFGDEVLNLREKICRAEGSHDKFQVAEDWLLGRYNSKEPSKNLLDFIELLQNEPVSKFSETMEGYPYTHKQLIQHFKKYVGLTPKTFQRILRFNETLKMIQNEEKLSWPEIAYSCDYSDQSHFIKEFYLFSGFSPEEYLRMEFTKDEAVFLPLDKKG